MKQIVLGFDRANRNHIAYKSFSSSRFSTYLLNEDEFIVSRKNQREEELIFFKLKRPPAREVQAESETEELPATIEAEGEEGMIPFVLLLLLLESEIGFKRWLRGWWGPGGDNEEDNAPPPSALLFSTSCKRSPNAPYFNVAITSLTACPNIARQSSSWSSSRRTPT